MWFGFRFPSHTSHPSVPYPLPSFLLFSVFSFLSFHMIFLFPSVSSPFLTFSSLSIYFYPFLFIYSTIFHIRIFFSFLSSISFRTFRKSFTDWTKVFSTTNLPNFRLSPCNFEDHNKERLRSTKNDRHCIQGPSTPAPILTIIPKSKLISPFEARIML